MMKRWYEHVSSSNKEGHRASNYHYHLAIKKYGKDDWEHEILVDKIETLEEASNFEKEFIKKFNSYDEGYNKTLGGVTGYTYTRPKKSTAGTYKKYWFYHIELGTEYCTRGELCKKYNLNRSHLTKVFKGTRNHTQGWTVIMNTLLEIKEINE